MRRLINLTQVGSLSAVQASLQNRHNVPMGVNWVDDIGIRAEIINGIRVGAHL